MGKVHNYIQHIQSYVSQKYLRSPHNSDRTKVAICTCTNHAPTNNQRDVQIIDTPMHV